MKTRRCVMIGPNSGATLANGEQNVLVIANGKDVYLRIDFDRGTVVLAGGDGPFLNADFKHQPAPLVWVRGSDVPPYELAVRAFEDFAKVFRASYENDPDGGLPMQAIKDLDRAMPFDELMSRFDVEGDGDGDGEGDGDGDDKD
jgi:hypothetical protein